MCSSDLILNLACLPIPPLSQKSALVYLNFDESQELMGLEVEFSSIQGLKPTELSQKGSQAKSSDQFSDQLGREGGGFLGIVSR